MNGCDFFKYEFKCGLILNLKRFLQDSSAAFVWKKLKTEGLVVWTFTV